MALPCRILTLSPFDRANLLIMTYAPPIDPAQDFAALGGTPWRCIFERLAEECLIVRVYGMPHFLPAWREVRAVSRNFRRAADATWFTSSRFLATNRVEAIERHQGEWCLLIGEGEP